MADFYQIAYTEVKQHNEDSWQVNLYEYKTTPGSVKKIPLMSDIKYKRGNANKGKFEYIKATQFDFQIVDVDGWLAALFEEKNDEYFQAKIMKNGSLFFIGNIYVEKNIYDPNVSKSIVNIKVYDAIKRLKNYSSLSDFGSGLVSLSEMFRKCLNVLDYQIDLQLYENISIGFGSDGINSFNRLFVEISEFAALKSNMNYYDILLNFAKTYGFNIYQENGIWIFRENNAIRTGFAYKVGSYLINYSTGAVTTSGSVDLTANIAAADLGKNRTAYDYEKVNEFEFNVGYVNIPKGHIDWINPTFNQASTGWNVTSGSGNFNNNNLQLDPGEEYYQTSGPLDAGEVVLIDFSVMCSRMVLAAGEIIDAEDNPLVTISYITAGPTYYYNFLSDTWQTTLTDACKYGVDLYGVSVYDIDAGSNIFDTQYTTKEAVESYEITLPAADGNVQMILYGGGTASGNGYPLEISAQHNECNVRRKEINANAAAQASAYSVNSNAPGYQLDIKTIIKEDVLLHDLDSFLKTSYWYSMYDQYETPDTWYLQSNDDWTIWDAGSQMLLEALTKTNIKYNLDNKAIDIDVLPGHNFSFTDYLYGSFGNLSNKYYIPVYEEGFLILGTQRIIAHEHEYKTAASLTTSKSYSY